MNLTTPSHKIWPMRATGAEDTQATINARIATTGDFAQKPASNVVDLLADAVEWAANTTEKESLTHDLEANGIEIYIAASDAHSKTLNWYLTAWRNENGPAKRVAVGTAVTGTQQVVKYPHNGVTIANMFWCDEIDITWENWLKEIESTDTDGNSNSVGSLWLDACGYRYWMIEFITTGTAAPATNIVAYYGRF